MGRRWRWLTENYEGLGRRDKVLFWASGVAAFVASLVVILLTRRVVDLTILLQGSVAQIVAAAVVGILASLLYLYIKAKRGPAPISQTPTEELRDLIYFDFDKAASIYSQISGGLLKEKQEASEEAKERRQLARVDLRVAQPEFGTVASERTSVLESKVLHHDLLNRLEHELYARGLLLNVNEEAATEDSDYSDHSLHELVTKPSFIIVRGAATVEDYNRFGFVASNFKDLIAFLNKCMVQGVKQSPEYQGLQEFIKSAREEVKQEKNAQRKNQMKFQLREIETRVANMLEPEDTIEDVPEWLLEGIQSFITTFMPNRINLRIYPFEQNPKFEILSNLKQEYFVDSDLENVTFAYGTRPNVPFTVLGLITSIPSKEGETFDPMAKVKGEDNSEDAQFEMGFRQALRAFENFERLVRFSRYPNVTVYPIAVYQSLNKIARNDADKSSFDQHELVSRKADQAQLYGVNSM